MPIFLKTHSYGEYMFDWAWADAYQRYGLDYYPKLLNAIPFTPATGKRWGIDATHPETEVIAAFQDALTKEAHDKQLSSCHTLFLSQPASDAWCCHKPHNKQINQQWLPRVGYQYHWFNDDYTDFEDFLSRMSSRKRKNIRKERDKIRQQQIKLVTRIGSELTQQEWQTFHSFYQSTYYKRSGHLGYLSPSFFPMLAELMGENLIVVQAYNDRIDHDNNDWVAAALFFRDQHTLYGRYWGCAEDYDGLHFEACYYQGIDYAIKHQLSRFDPGAQGEHKIQRGFKPVLTHSAHQIINPEFSPAIAQFLVHEKKEVEEYIASASQHLPFKKS